ncbi:hypothetical protein [Anabaena subtropica]|uniref:Uncharacterized protein n=1 Tax=Anabaena subtropica FACHB-260 TaxID=2692884 RepID=A0ABR8CUJ0_9NOST|nr:hypothetical protein [Anabaena subtropica]MBD2346846.1 hypothetical protein [Anabaena subtropica FACHB-260]
MVRWVVVVKQATLQTDKVPKFEDSTFARNQFDVQKQIIASVKRSQSEENINASTIDSHTCICLNLEDLKCFEVVEHQYEHWGVIFHNSLAIQPSNPAFPTNSGLTVLMGAPKSGFLEVTFLRGVNQVNACVTSSQRLVLSAYDRDRQLLAQSILPSANLANSDSALPPNTLLSVTTQNIHSVTFCAFDGQFTLNEFRFCI